MPAFAGADDLLYATDGTSLFTVDLTSGSLTFQSDGPLQWIASPAFDEDHHTRFFFSAPQNSFIGWSYDHIPYIWGDPFTGVTGDGTATLSQGPASSVDDWFDPITTLCAYAPTTQRLYLVGYHVDPELRVIMADQLAGPRVDWVAGDVPRGAWIEVPAMAFDPTTNCIAVAINSGDDQPDGYNDWTSCWIELFPLGGQNYLSPIGVSADTSTPVFNPDGSAIIFPAPLRSIGAMAFEPTSGDIYYTRYDQILDESFVWHRGWTLRRFDRVLRQDFEICTLDRPLQLRFARDSYVR
jgi:hypothetical protein